MTGAEAPRIVTFDLMTRDPDYYFVLSEALGDFAARQRGEAEDDPGRTQSIRWAETAESALERIESALSTVPPPPTAAAARAFLERIDNSTFLRTIETRALNGGWVGSRGVGAWDTKVSDAISRAAIRAVIDLFRAWAAECDEPVTSTPETPATEEDR